MISIGKTGMKKLSFTTIFHTVSFMSIVCSSSAFADDGIDVYVDGSTQESVNLKDGLSNNRSLIQNGFSVQNNECLNLPCSRNDNYIFIKLSYANYRYTAQVSVIKNGELVEQKSMMSSSLTSLETKLGQVIPHIYSFAKEGTGTSNQTLESGSTNTASIFSIDKNLEERINSQSPSNQNIEKKKEKRSETRNGESRTNIDSSGQLYRFQPIL